MWLCSQVVNLVSCSRFCIPDRRKDATRRRRARVVAHKDSPAAAVFVPSLTVSRVAFNDRQPAPPTRREIDQPPCQPPCYLRCLFSGFRLRAFPSLVWLASLCACSSGRTCCVRV
ncbi:uncharacterized protein B0H18DRAFT_983529 [Fomitopsis serialis]|uniref:uncharacterized protein n=1 Tax=Fomitopsis serialis TaxID=139415 RepID=UPI0020081B26|nr:uncharacterized protein B0H18DRAFT_983529 [Neoantrodia serialis]KAH9933408.1 hypothetical protein B0H18DRAFT_983529 [Neoantrodia serialis]